MFSKRRAQGTLEYALLIAAVVAALISIKVYMTRAIQGRLRQSSDQIGEHFEPQEGAVNITWKTYMSGGSVITEHHPGDTAGVMTTITTDEASFRSKKESWGSPPDLAGVN